MGTSEAGDAGPGRYWNWLPTHDGAVRRDLVRSFRVVGIDGQFRGGSTRAWTVDVFLEGEAEPVTLRPLFLDGSLLAAWVDKVFLGASFQLMPPHVLGGAGGPPPADPVPDDVELDAGLPAGVRAVGRPFPAGQPALPTGHSSAAAIRGIGDGLLGTNPYEPFAGQRGGRAPSIGGQIG